MLWLSGGFSSHDLNPGIIPSLHCQIRSLFRILESPRDKGGFSYLYLKEKGNNSSLQPRGALPILVHKQNVKFWSKSSHRLSRPRCRPAF